MIDFHNHVLPGVDDGPKEIEDSLKMLQHASKQGITEIVQTVHFQHPKMEGKNVEYDFLKEKIKEIQDLINQNNLNIKMHLSAEVFYLPNLLQILNNPLVTIGKNKYMLIEFSSNIFPIGYEDEFYKLQCEGVTPIIAHPERYRFVKKNLNILKIWKERDYIIQLDAGSLLGKFGNETKLIVDKILEEKNFHLIGSDSHNYTTRNFCLNDAYKKISDIHGLEVVKVLKENSSRILKGKEVINFDSINNRKKSYKSIIEKVVKLFNK
tara:strand:+ start:207 stop:1004 length:798 start_codon:yes stop_codon:yes gene_type:complete